MTKQLTPVKISGWIHQHVSSDPDAAPGFAFWTWRSTSDDWIPLCEYTLETEVQTSHDELIQAAVKILDMEATVALEKYRERMDEINERRATLLALPSPKAFSADSVGGAEE